MENHDSIRARQALESIAATRSDLADRLVTPWFHYPVLAALLSGMVLVYGLDRFRDSPLRTLFAFVVILGSLGLVQVHTRMTGVQVGRPAGPRSKWMLFVFAIGLLAPLLWVVITEPGWGVVLALAAFVLVFTVLCGRAYDTALRADLRGGPNGTDRR
ncbi:hypothetical protein ASG90_00150 [Nocardioides sp. Soil797]|nr:hypothetical protein ASG90_00150 [Nocardioides sp. Soil797]